MLSACMYLVDANAGASLSIAGEECASGEKLRSLHLGWIDVGWEKSL
jgi:hypothetical protein